MARHYVTQVEGVPAPTSPISHAVVVNDHCHISGQLSIYEDGYRPGTAQQEAERAFELVFRIVEAAGFCREEIAYLDIAFSQLQQDLAAVNQVIEAHFSHYPARTIYEAKALPFGARIKVQAIAIKDAGSAE